MSFIVQCKSNGTFLSKGGWTKNINEARTYKRKCDASNSVIKSFRACKGEYKVIACKISLPSDEGLFVLKNSRTDGWPNFPEICFANKREAEKCRDWLCSMRGLHKDYITVEALGKLTSLRKRPDWEDYFLGLALVISRRSHDIHTQHGCVLVDSSTHRILSTGYNGFPRAMVDDSQLPLNRPDPSKPDEDDKYPWMMHSEFNACCNLNRPADKYTVAYITGEPCTPCLMCLWQHGVERAVYRDALGSKYLIDEKTRKRREVFIRQSGMSVKVVNPDLSWLEDVLPK